MRLFLFFFFITTSLQAAPWAQELRTELDKQQLMLEMAHQNEDQEIFWPITRIQWRTQFFVAIDIPYILNVSVVPEIEISWVKRRHSLFP